MKKTIHISVVLIILTLIISCNINGQKKKIHGADGIDCDQFSKVITELVQFLEQDNYTVNIKESNGLEFEREKINAKVDTTISFPKSQCMSIYVKRKNKLKDMEANWYPSFSVTEICFQDESTASKSHKIISEIINSSDLFNEKNYDYILKNGSRLIYVSCSAKIYEKYAFSYKSKIEEIILNNKR